MGSLDVFDECGLCTWHPPDYADGMPVREFQRAHRIVGGGVFHPFEEGNKSWVELVAWAGQAFEQFASRYLSGSVMVVAHAEVVQSSLTVFRGVPLDQGFDVKIAPTAITEWTTSGDPDAWPRPRWTLVHLNDSAHAALVSLCG